MPIVNVMKETELKNAYIGEYRVPGVNTVAYYKFDKNLNDSSGNNYNPTNNSNVSIATLDGLKCAYFNSWYITYPDIHTTFNSSFTFSMWIQISSWNKIFISEWQPGYSKLFAVQRVDDVWELLKVWFYSNDLSARQNFSQWWEHWAFTIDWSSHYGVIYFNWTQKATKNYRAPNVQSWPFYVWTNAEVPWNSGWVSTWYMSEFIIENKARTAQEVTDYYNSTKSDYGL